MTKYSNPRLSAVIRDWPHGSRRVTATFEIETDKRGQRAVRTTTGAPKKLTYARKARIVDGDDGLTYVAELSRNYSHIVIMHGNMKYQHDVIFPGNSAYPELLKLFD